MTLFSKDMEKEIKGKCYICGEPLIWNENDENCCMDDYMDEEGTVIKEIKCPHCGTLYRYYITEENKSDIEEDSATCGDKGFGECANCGGTVIWGGDFMRSDFENDPITGETLDEDDDAIVRSLTCGHCGCSMEVWETSVNEMKSGKYKHWNDYFNKKK